MKILSVICLYPPHHIGGYELRCLEINRMLRQRGHTVEVLTSDHRIAAAIGQPEDPGTERSLRIHGFFGNPWLGIEELRDLEFHNHKRLCLAIKRVKPDVVLVSAMGGLSKSFVLTLMRLGIPVCYDLCDHWIARSMNADVWLQWWNRRDASLPARLRRALWTVTGRRAAWDKRAPTNPIRHARFPRIFFCSAALRDLTARAGFPVSHGQVIHCHVNIERFRGEPPALDHPVRKLLYVGRVVEDKGVMTALRAMRELKGEVPVVLTICGNGDADYVKQLKTFVEDNALPVRFTSAGMAEMAAMYKRHDALLFTSEWEEPIALTPLEAMASGLPVIGTTTGGSIEIFRDGENALTYKAGNPTELAARIRTLAGDPVLARRLATTALAEVSRYSLPVIVDQIEAYLKDTIAHWQPTPLPSYHAA